MSSRINSDTEPRGLYFSKALFEGLTFEGAYTWRGLFSAFYGSSSFSFLDRRLDALVRTYTSLTKSKENERLLAV